MAHIIGLKVLHLSGFETTKKLMELCKINENSKVSNIGCSKGTSSFYIAKKYGRKVIGIDASEKMINEATALAEKEKLSNKIKFIVCDAENFPFNLLFFPKIRKRFFSIANHFRRNFYIFGFGINVGAK